MSADMAGGMDVKGFMIDMDGTICKGWNVIPGALEFLQELREKGLPFVLLTNNSSYSRQSYLRKFHSLGFQVELDDILTSTTATALFLRTEREGRTVFPLGTPDFLQEIEEAGIEIREEGADIVLLAFDRSITYEKINRAYHLLLDGAELICTHPDRLCPTEDGYDVDIGPFIDMFRSLTGVQPLVIGKPSRRMVEMASRQMRIPVGGLAMIGDRLYTDIRMAVDGGITSVLVLSGETKAEDLETSEIQPDIVAASVQDLRGFF
ncbi:MAG: HAD-IIA family hydrolase [Candidatus Methanomethylophilaceae archaeon]